jgi:hypothetical protein
MMESLKVLGGIGFVAAVYQYSYDFLASYVPSWLVFVLEVFA